MLDTGLLFTCGSTVLPCLLLVFLLTRCAYAGGYKPPNPIVLCCAVQEIVSLRAELVTSTQRVDELEGALAAATAAAAVAAATAAAQPDTAQQEEQQQLEQELQRLAVEVEEHRNAAAALRGELEAARTQHAQQAAVLEGRLEAAEAQHAQQLASLAEQHAQQLAALQQEAAGAQAAATSAQEEAGAAAAAQRDAEALAGQHAQRVAELEVLLDSARALAAVAEGDSDAALQELHSQLAAAQEERVKLAAQLQAADTAAAQAQAVVAELAEVRGGQAAPGISTGPSCTHARLVLRTLHACMHACCICLWGGIARANLPSWLKIACWPMQAHQVGAGMPVEAPREKLCAATSSHHHHLPTHKHACLMLPTGAGGSAAARRRARGPVGRRPRRIPAGGRRRA